MFTGIVEHVGRVTAIEYEPALAARAEATLVLSGVTLLMTMAMLGDDKSAYPTPCAIRIAST